MDSQLNTEVTTAFPIDQAIGDLAAGVYVMSAEPAGPKADNYEDLATQWFVISDLGLTAFSGNDGIHVFVNSLADTTARPQIEIRLIARNNEVMATRRTDDAGHVLFEPGLARGEGGLSPALIVASDLRGDYGFLSLKTPAFDFSDRGVTGRAAPTGLDAFVFTERGVYRTGETVHVTTLLRDALGAATPNVPITLVVDRPDGVEYRRAVVADQGIGGRNLDLVIAPTASTGTWHVHAYGDPKRPAIGEANFLVEDYVPDRMEFALASKAQAVSRGRPFDVTVDGRFLYGAPASNLDIGGAVKVKAAADRPACRAISSALRMMTGTTPQSSSRSTICRRPTPPATPSSMSLSTSCRILPRLLEAQVTITMAEPGGRAIERKLTLPVTPASPMIGVKPLFAGGALAESANANFDVVVISPDGKPLARNGLRYELLKIESRYQWYRQDGAWNYEPIKQTKRVADGILDVAAEQPGRISVPVVLGPLSP